MKLKVHSLRAEHIRTYNNRECENEDNINYVLNCISDNNQKYEISLWTEYGDCYSGWCAASWGHGEIRKVKSFIGMTHKPIRELTFEFDIDRRIKSEVILKDIKNDIFYINYEDGDDWYPSGSAGITEELFVETNRNMHKRPVWIFRGDSALGKSYLSGIIQNSDRMKIVYETDAHEELEDIDADIIVVGNKYNHSIEEITQKIKGEHEIILVDFSKPL